MSTADDRLLQRLAALLAMAEGSANEAEAEAFMVKAQKLSTLYSIDLATTRAGSTSPKSTPTVDELIIGPPRKHGLANYVLLAAEIADANNLRASVSHNNTAVYLHGFAEDIALTRQLYGSLLTQMVAESEKYLATGEYRNLSDWRQVTKTDSVGRYRTWEFGPISKSAARSSFQQGYAYRIGERLAETKAQTEAEVIAADQSGTELVLIEKSRQVTEFYERTSDARGSWRGVKSSGWSESAHDAGNRAADSARLRDQNSISCGVRALR